MKIIGAKEIVATCVVLSCSICVWVACFTHPNIKAPFLQGLIFMLILSVLGWVVIGCPRPGKMLSFNEIVLHLKNDGFQKVGFKSTDDLPIENVSMIMKKSNMFFTFSDFENHIEALKSFHKMRRQLIEENKVISYETTIIKNNYCRYTQKTGDTYFSVLCIDTKVIFIYSDIENDAYITGLLKSVHLK